MVIAGGTRDCSLQDLLNLGAEARMNVPGRAGGNWRWRWQEDTPLLPALEWLKELTETSRRSDQGISGQPKTSESVVVQVGQ